MQEQDKIKLYEEVLIQDPASTLFFPLAKLYLQEDRVDGALYVLETGLKYHPAHVEARMLLVQVLQQQGKEQAIKEQIAAIAANLRRYPDFWHGWADQLEKEGDADFALAARFIGLRLSGHDISWCDLIGNALKGLTREGLRNLDQMSFAPVSVEAEQPEDAPEKDQGAREVRDFVEDFQKTAFPDLEPDPEKEAGSLQGEAQTEESERSDGSSGRDESVFRTKTMADILAQQGDYRGARDIYADLAQSSESEELRKELSENVDRMRRLMEQYPERDRPRAAAPEAADQGTSSSGHSTESPEDTADLKTVLESEEAGEEGSEEHEPAGSGGEFPGYRTRTMADILVRQGSYREAREIFAELQAKSEDPQSQSDLQAQVDRMDRFLGDSEQPVAEAPEGESAGSDTEYVLEMLHRLAERLESRPREEAGSGQPAE
jgi:thioredoxin-like negative regulator of GroEL